MVLFHVEFPSNSQHCLLHKNNISVVQRETTVQLALTSQIFSGDNASVYRPSVILL